LYYKDGSILDRPVAGAQIAGLIMCQFKGIPLSQVFADERLTEEKVFIIGGQIAGALSHLNANRVIHGDVDGDNVLICGELKVVKLIDFGLTRRVSSDDGIKASITARLLSSSPEIHEKKPHDEKTDAWSFGILLYQMLHRGKVPFKNKTDILEKELKVGSRVSLNLQQVLKGLLTKNPAYRMTIHEANKLLQQALKSVEK
jgi:serine/threonine protein kinase